MKKERAQFTSKWILLPLFIGVSLLAFAPSLSNPFLFDDVTILAKNQWLTFNHLPAFFRSFVHTSTLQFPGYRPLVMSTFVFENEWFGLAPEVFRLTNILLHALMAFLVFFFAQNILFRSLPNKGRWSLLAALIFCLHPVQTNVISLIWKRTDLLVALGILGALLSFDAFVRTSDRTRLLYWFVGLICSLVAFLSKEISLLLFPLLILFDLFFWKPQLNAKKRILLYLPILVFSLAYAWILFKILPHTLKPMRMAGMEHIPSALQLSSLDYLSVQISAWFEYARLAIWPHPLEVFHPLPTSELWLHTSFWMGLLFLGFVCGGTLAFFKNHRPISFSLLWFFLLLLPASSIFPLALPFDEDRLYLPLMGFSILLTYLSFQTFSFFSSYKTKSFRSIYKGALILLVCVYVLLAWSRLFEWKSGLSLWASNVSAYPEDPRPWVQLGISYAQEEKEFQKAYQAFQHALILDPEFGSAHYFYGEALMKAGQFEKARVPLHRALRLNALRPKALNLLGTSHLKTNEPALGLTYLVEGLTLDQKDLVAFRNLSLLLERYHQPQASREILKKAWWINPNDPETNRRLGVRSPLGSSD